MNKQHEEIRELIGRVEMAAQEKGLKFNHISNFVTKVKGIGKFSPSNITLLRNMEVVRTKAPDQLLLHKEKLEFLLSTIEEMEDRWTYKGKSQEKSHYRILRSIFSGIRSGSYTIWGSQTPGDDV